MTPTSQSPMTPPELTEAQQRALQLLGSAKRVLLTGHERPDGDCIGAQAALFSVLRHLGKQVFVVNPGLPESQYDYLARELDYTSFDPAQGVPDHDLSILLDCSELSRCGALGAVLGEHSSSKLVIDHHVHPGEQWWDEAFQDVTCSATGLLVRRIARALQVPLDSLLAHGVFTSMVTDTGWFKYSNTDAETLATAAEMVDFGLDPSTLYGAIYQRRAAELPQRVAQVLQGLEYHHGGRLALVQMPLDADGRAPDFDSEEVLDLLRSVEAVEVVIFLRQVEPEVCKLSARSKTEFNVQQLAQQFGGGGHVKAAGATIPGQLGDVAGKLVDAAGASFATKGTQVSGGGKPG